MKNYWLDKQEEEERKFRRVIINGSMSWFNPKFYKSLSYDYIVSYVNRPGVSVVYRSGPDSKPSGILCPGDEVPLVDGLVINAYVTGSA